ncbi:hypothetical protein [uncultured Dysgonomonas sp.]|nr:hypothetical protein [uncultured Dysgonomonas sp.]
MKKTKFKLERRTAFEFKKSLNAEGSKSLGHPTTTTATTQPTISFTCKV